MSSQFIGYILFFLYLHVPFIIDYFNIQGHSFAIKFTRYDNLILSVSVITYSYIKKPPHFSSFFSFFIFPSFSFIFVASLFHLLLLSPPSFRFSPIPHFLCPTFHFYSPYVLTFVYLLVVFYLISPFYLSFSYLCIFMPPLDRKPPLSIDPHIN